MDEQVACAEGHVTIARLLAIFVPGHLKLTQEIVYYFHLEVATMVLILHVIRH